MSIFIFIFTQLFSEVAPSQLVKPARKQNLTQNSQSRSSKVMHFGITEKPTTDCISPYKAGSLKYPKKVASEIAEICCSRQPHSRVTPPFPGTIANIRIILIPPVLESLAYMLVYLHSNFCGGLRKTHVFRNGVRIFIGRSRSSKVVDFGTNRKGVYDFLLVINRNFGLILYRF